MVLFGSPEACTARFAPLTTEHIDHVAIVSREKAALLRSAAFSQSVFILF